MKLFKGNGKFTDLAKSIYCGQHNGWNLVQYDLVGLANLNQQYTFLNLPKRYFMSHRKMMLQGWEFWFGFEFDNSSLDLPPFIEIELRKGDQKVRIVAYGDKKWSFANSTFKFYFSGDVVAYPAPINF